ncbi:MAG: flagellar motor switch protein FliN [Planctomycetaceae bacterium]|nr:flagellar motor switch protein FliN [Planctomycetaceae bacterium]
MPTTSPDAVQEQSANGGPETNTSVDVHPAEFPEMTSSPNHGAELPLNRFLDVTLQASVELGQAQISIGEVLKLGQGAVVQLDRDVTDPVDILVQGVRLARGEVVIVDDSYAVRITQVESGQIGRMNGTSREGFSEGATA